MIARPALLLVAAVLVMACGRGDAKPAATADEPVVVDCGLVSAHDPSHQGMDYGVSATGVECDEAFRLFAEAEFDEQAKNFRMPGWTCSNRDNGSMEYSFDCVNGEARISRD